MSIVFQSIRWKNFLSTGNVFTEVKLNENKQTLIVGNNGAGKSTILDALSYALYNKPFRNINKPQLLNSINMKNMLVEVEFNIGSDRYVIRRGMKPTVFEIYKNDGMINQDAASRDYQEYLEKNIIKLNHKSFSQIVVLGSASFIPFMQLTAANRRAVIEDLLDIQVFSVMNAVLKSRLTENKNKIYNTDHIVTILREKIKLQREHISRLKEDKDQIINNIKGNITRCEEIIASSTGAVELKRNNVSTLLSAIADNQKNTSRLQSLSKLESQLEDKLTRIKKEIDFFHNYDTCPTCRQDIDNSFKCEMIENRSTNVNELTEGLNSLIEQHQKAIHRQSEIEKILLDISNAEKEIININNEISLQKSLIARYNDELKKYSEQKIEIVQNNTEYNELELQLKEGQNTKDTLVKEQYVLELVGNLLKDTGIKAKIIKQYIPVMNKLINKYLASMDFFVNFELNENFEEKIKSRYRDEFSYASFSEGEKMRLNLAILFAWRAIAKLRNSASMNILFFDEVLDSSLDNAGIDDFMKIIYNLTADTNIFIISHKTDVMSDKFPNMIRFEKVKNFSRISS
jgi:DNA repair exonuclease SbcCD ATPase subunit